jgi:hypothetical protein
VRIAKVILRLSNIAALGGGASAFAAQWLIFKKGNFSQTSGQVFVPTLGEHGIYTSRLLGMAWYIGLTIFSVGLLAWVIGALVEKTRTRE